MNAIQEACDAFYMKHGPCCAGCDWWRAISSLAGDCRKSAPVPDAERWAMLGIQSCTLQPGAGHVVTLRDHHCGDFCDEFDWTSLPLGYRVRIGDRSLRGARS